MKYYPNIQTDQAYYSPSALERQTKRRVARAFVKGAFFAWLLLMIFLISLFLLHTFASQDSTLLIRVG